MGEMYLEVGLEEQDGHVVRPHLARPRNIWRSANTNPIRLQSVMGLEFEATGTNRSFKHAEKHFCSSRDACSSLPTLCPIRASSSSAFIPHIGEHPCIRIAGRSETDQSCEAFEVVADGEQDGERPLVRGRLDEPTVECAGDSQLNSSLRSSANRGTNLTTSCCRSNATRGCGGEF